MDLEAFKNYIKILKIDDGDIVVFDERYVHQEQANQAFSAIKKEHGHTTGILLENLDGIGIITLPRKHG